MEQEITIDTTDIKVQTKEEMALEDAIHYLGSFTLPLKEDTITIYEDEEGKHAKLDEEFALRLKALLKRQEEMDNEVAAFKEYALKILSENDITEKITSEGVNLLLTKAYVRNSVDSAKLKEMLPSIYDFFKKETNVRASVGIKLDKEETYNPWLK